MPRRERIPMASFSIDGFPPGSESIVPGDVHPDIPMVKREAPSKAVHRADLLREPPLYGIHAA
jgi:hypothetical protein